jgi:hypothetical protein
VNECPAQTRACNTGFAAAGDHASIASAAAFVVSTWVVWLCVLSSTPIQQRDKITAAIFIADAMCIQISLFLRRACAHYAQQRQLDDDEEQQQQQEAPVETPMPTLNVVGGTATHSCAAHVWPCRQSQLRNNHRSNCSARPH